MIDAIAEALAELDIGFFVLLCHARDASPGVSKVRVMADYDDIIEVAIERITENGRNRYRITEINWATWRPERGGAVLGEFDTLKEAARMLASRIAKRAEKLGMVWEEEESQL